MTVTSNPTTTQTASNTASSAATRTAKKDLGQEDFLQLLTVQLTKQDPMKPMDDTAFIAQMAQFSALSQSSQLVTEMGFLRADTQMLAASGLLGRQVTLANNDGTQSSGVVEAVEADATTVYVNVGGQRYEYARIVGVTAPPVTTTTDESPASTP